MTTGSRSTGAVPIIWSSGFHYQKTWSGTNGETIPGRVSRKKQWNAYTMAYRVLRSTNANKILIWNPIHSPPDFPGPEVRDNHAYESVICASGTISRTFPQAEFDTYWTSKEELALLAKLRTKVNGHSYNMGVSLAEVDKLAGTVKGTLSTLCFGVADLLTGNFRKFARRFGTSPPSLRKSRRLLTTDVSGRFLEMRYAWEPAIQDAYEAAKAFEALSNGPRQQTFRSARRKVVQLHYTTNYSGGVEMRIYSRQYIFEMYEEMTAFRQMGLGNPLSILWERIPWSFVVDWFIPVGTYLELIGQVPFMKGRWCRTDKVLYTLSGEIDKSDQHGGFDILPGNPTPNMYGRRLNLQRIISFTPPSVPRPTLNVFGAVQGRRVGNAVALAHQVFAKAASITPRKGRNYSAKELARPVSYIETVARAISRL